MKRVAVTGGFGFLGRYLIEELASKSPELEVTAVDLQATPPHRRDAVRYLGGVDIGNPDSLDEAFRGADAVLHLAGLVSFWSGDRDRLFQINQIGTRNVAEACVRRRVKRLVHVSSVAAVGYNDREDEPANEMLAFDWQLAANKHYMLSKRASELELRAAAEAGVAVAIGAPGLMYGPGDKTNLPMFRAVQSGRMAFVPPGGTNVVDVRDVAAGLRLLLLSDVRDERFILGGHNLRFTEVVRTIAAALKRAGEPRRLPARMHSPAHLVARAFEAVWPRRPPIASDLIDSSFRFRYFASHKASRMLGWRPRIPFTRTIADTAEQMFRDGSLLPLGGAS